MSKELNLNKSVYELVMQYPELKQTLYKLGFKELTNDLMLKTMGKTVTIPKAAKIKGISMMKIVPALMMKGYELTGKRPSVSFEPKEDDNENVRKIKEYLNRLNDGEQLEDVREDFIAEFSDVDPSEIMQAEQDLIKDGAKLEDVTRLCDVHSALFHGTTREEQIENAEKAVALSLQQKQLHANNPERQVRYQNLSAIKGHPLYTFRKENEAIEKLLNEIREHIDEEQISDMVMQAKQVSVHYAKKGDLIYPILKVNYGISGPNDVMWTVDDEIRDNFSKLARTSEHDAAWKQTLLKTVTRAEEMLYKEANILYPITAEKFTEPDWIDTYFDSQAYDVVLGVEHEKWEGVERTIQMPSFGKDEIVLGGGHMTVDQLNAMLNAMPFEISFIDENNINRYFNEGEKMFKRPKSALDREVFACHPPKIEPMVRQILDAFRNGTSDQIPVWMEKNGHTYLVTYMAVRDNDGRYYGAMELVQNMDEAKKHFSK